MFFSKTIDRLALYDLHRKRSKDKHFSAFSLDAMAENEFYKSSIADVSIILKESRKKYMVGTFSYESLIPSGDLVNDTLTGEVFLNENDIDKPNVIFVHGWRMNSYDRIKKIFHHRIMKDVGWNMYYYSLPYHLEREPENSLYSGELMISADIDRTVESTRQAIVDLRALIHWIKANKKGPVIIVGVSLGGWITNLMATLEPQIDAVVSIFYANRLSYSIWNTIPGKFIREELEQHGVTYEDLIKYWEITDPSQAVPKVNKDNILLISAKHDQYIHLEDADYLWERWGKPERYLYNCGHAGIVLCRKKLASDTLSFIRKKLKR
ncbi:MULTISPECIES: alpha/beta hydrolase family protein [Bacillus]|uniref:alpha/beta hydrolase family protein n=1 Tax=Bacillus TaxID=1386 RepID=UPI0015822EE4|nr:alpha/beta hydrolase family protein [Bacillus glycinifermentans]MBU8785272.1 alpha/beta hydrolase family protein [Bacillus glycinifermentans]NUJ16916.1 abhydrolase domain-containing 18 [Bacillus glycinifermentans]